MAQQHRGDSSTTRFSNCGFFTADKRKERLLHLSRDDMNEFRGQPAGGGGVLMRTMPRGLFFCSKTHGLLLFSATCIRFPRQLPLSPPSVSSSLVARRLSASLSNSFSRSPPIQPIHRPPAAFLASTRTPYFGAALLHLEAVLPQLVGSLGVQALVLRVAAELEEQRHDGVKVSSKPVSHGATDGPNRLSSWVRFCARAERKPAVLWSRRGRWVGSDR